MKDFYVVRVLICRALFLYIMLLVKYIGECIVRVESRNRDRGNTACRFLVTNPG